MAFTIPDVAAAWNPIQARVQTGDVQILTDGISGVGVSSGCAVTPQGSPNMTVAVASGTVRIGGAAVSVTSGNVTITANSSGQPRLDLICVNASGTKSAQAGTAAASPKYPAIPASSVVLASVLVPTGAASITANNIVDKRSFVLSVTGLVAANNLSDVASASTSRTNLGAAATSHTHATTDVVSGTMATARLGSGTASSSTFLRGDQTWASASGSGARTTRTPEQDGAFGDGRFFIANTTSGSATLTSPAGPFGAAFTAGDTGKTVWVPGAGAAGALKVATVTYVSATTVTMASTAGTSVTGAKTTIGHNDTAALDTWLARGDSTILNQATPGAVYIHDTILDTANAKTGMKVDLTGAQLWAVIEDASAVWFIDCVDLEVWGGTLRVSGLSNVRGNEWEDQKLLFDGCTRLSVHDMDITNSKTGGMYAMGCVGFVVRNCTFRDTLADGFHIVSGCKDGLVLDCVGFGCGDDTISMVSYTDAFYPPDPVTNVRVINCKSYYPTFARGFSIIGGVHCGFVDCETIGAQYAGFYIAQEGTWNSHPVTDCFVVGGLVRDFCRNPAIDQGGILLYNSLNNSVMRNVVVRGVEVWDSASPFLAAVAARAYAEPSATAATFSACELGTTASPIIARGTYWESPSLIQAAGVTAVVEKSAARTPAQWMLGTLSNTPGAIAANANPTSYTVTVTGAWEGGVVAGVTHSGTNGRADGLHWWGHVTADNTVVAYVKNMNTTGSITVGAGTLSVIVTYA